jgi:hypothetical protein
MAIPTLAAAMYGRSDLERRSVSGLLNPESVFGWGTPCKMFGRTWCIWFADLVMTSPRLLRSRAA